MKNESIRKINGIGKASSIITKIMMVFTIIGMVGCLVGGIVTACMPKDALTVKMNGSMVADVDIRAFGASFDEVSPAEINREIQKNVKESITINDEEYIVTNIESIGDIIRVTTEGNTNIFTFKDICYVCFCGFVKMGCLLAILIFALRLCNEFMVCDTPFTETIIKMMNQLAIALIPWAVADKFLNSIIESAFKSQNNIVLGVDLGSVLVILIIIAITYVFKYGAKLQQESDETL